MTLVHIAMIFWLSALTRRILQCWTGKPRVILGWTDYLCKVAPTGENGVVTSNPVNIAAVNKSHSEKGTQRTAK